METIKPQDLASMAGAPGEERVSLWRSLIILGLVGALAGCLNQEYRFEQADGAQFSALPLKFDSLSGVRDGDSVKAELRFADGSDVAQIRIALRLGPPAQFISGAYHVTIGGRTSDGTVSCDSLTYLGGQADVPSVGGVFTLNDVQGRAAYHVRMPPTRIERRIRF